MIAEIRFKNMFSFRDEAILSFEADRSKDMESYHVVELGGDVRLLKVAVIYGANASGKSNIIKVCDFIKSFITYTPLNKAEQIQIVPFLLNKTSSRQLSEYSISFYLKNEEKAVRYVYSVALDRDNNNPNYKGRVTLYALSRFSTLMPSTNDCEVNQWSRLIRNLIENTRFDSSNDAVRVIKDIDTMLLELTAYYKENNGSSCVNDWVAQNTTFTPKGFTNSQWEEEKIKAELRKDSSWNDEITKAEKHQYLNGKIGLILWCSGEITGLIPFSKNTLNRDLNKFKSYSEKCLKLFNEAGQKDSEVTSKFLLVRAMLSKGDYMPNLSADRKNFYNDPGHRDYSWKALFRINDYTHIDALNILKQVLDDDNFNSANVSESLKVIINKRKRKDIPLWRRLLTSDYGVQILSHSRQGFIAFADGKIQNALIYGSSKRSGYHSELNILYIENLLKKFKPKASVSVTWNMGTEADYSIDINGHTISYWNDKWHNNNITLTALNELVKFIRNAIDNPV